MAWHAKVEGGIGSHKDPVFVYLRSGAKYPLHTKSAYFGGELILFADTDDVGESSGLPANELREEILRAFIEAGIGFHYEPGPPDALAWKISPDAAGGPVYGLQISPATTSPSRVWTHGKAGDSSGVWVTHSVQGLGRLYCQKWMRHAAGVSSLPGPWARFLTKLGLVEEYEQPAIKRYRLTAVGAMACSLSEGNTTGGKEG
jgi:hypothetical protein